MSIHPTHDAAVRVKVLFVCMGNICRSPTAQGVFRKLVETQALTPVIETDSAGTHSYHVGEPPDPRARETAARRHIDLSDLRARRVSLEDFQYFDYILAMDQDNYHSLAALCPPDSREKLRLFLEFAPELSLR